MAAQGFTSTSGVGAGAEPRYATIKFTIPRDSLLACVRPAPGATAPTQKEYMLVDKVSKIATGTFELQGPCPMSPAGSAPGSAVQTPVKAEPNQNCYC